MRVAVRGRRVGGGYGGDTLFLPRPRAGWTRVPGNLSPNSVASEARASARCDRWPWYSLHPGKHSRPRSSPYGLGGLWNSPPCGARRAGSCDPSSPTYHPCGAAVAVIGLHEQPDMPAHRRPAQTDGQHGVLALDRADAHTSTGADSASGSVHSSNSIRGRD